MIVPAGNKTDLQSMEITHLPFKIAIRNFSVRLQAPDMLVDAITWVTLGLQLVEIGTPAILRILIQYPEGFVHFCFS